MRITLVIGTLGSGGAERVISTMANHWVAAQHEITLISIESASNDFYPLDSRVRRLGLGLMGDSSGLMDIVGNNIARVRALRGAIVESRPEVIISFVDVVNVLTLLAAKGLRIPVIVSERVDPRVYSPGRAASILRRLLYSSAAAVVVQSEAVRPWSESLVGASKTFVIPNPVKSPAESAEGTTQVIAAMGRLVPQKGFDLLISAFAQASPGSDWELIIMGEGSERPRLESLTREMNLSDRIKLPGRVADPERVLCKSALFVLSSRFEGYPNVLLEAMACGLPCVSFDCPSGPREILRDKVDGLLVPPENVSALASSMKQLMGDGALRKKMGESAREVTNRYSPEKVIGLWDGVIAKVVARTN